MQAFNTPASIQIGQVNKKSIKFDDPKELTKQGGIDKINAIKVHFSDKYVIGLTLYYKLADGDYLKAAHNPPKDKKKYQKRVLEIGPDDYLLEIAGHYTEKGITRITFSTYRGKIGTYGSDEGTPFSYKFFGHTFGPLSGGFIDHLVHIEFPVVPVPQTFLNEFKPIQVNVSVNDSIKKVENFQNPSVGSNGGSNGGSFQQQVPQFQGMYVNPNQNLNNFGKVAQIPTFPAYQQPPQQNFNPNGQYHPQNNSHQQYDYFGNQQQQYSEKQMTKSDLISSKYPAFK